MDSMDSLLKVRIILSIIQPLFGALILLCFYLWLRGRQVKDQSLIWLFSTLFSQTLPGISLLVLSQQDYTWVIPAFCSPVSNILITVTAFQLLRVREAIRLHNLQTWPKVVQWVVAVGGLTGMILFAGFREQPGVLTVANNVDAMTSLIALSSMAFCLSYSFYKYGNQPLIVLTVIDFLYTAWYQFYAVRSNSFVENEFIVALNITSVAIMTMLFIALTLAWGISYSSRLQFRDSESVDVIVMFVDLRGSTKWVKDVADPKYVVNFMNKFTQWILSRASEAPYGLPNVKHTGDGFMVVWEVADRSLMMSQVNAVVGLGCALCSSYKAWLRNTAEFYKSAPHSLGVGIDFGPANRLTSENGSCDYLGLPLNYAAKFQDLARPDGGVVIRDSWELTEELLYKFTRKGTMAIGKERISIRATEGVKLLPVHRNGSNAITN
jgi:class 3 adenylate cyclase